MYQNTLSKAWNIFEILIQRSVASNGHVNDTECSESEETPHQLRCKVVMYLSKWKDLNSLKRFFNMTDWCTKALYQRGIELKLKGKMTRKLHVNLNWTVKVDKGVATIEQYNESKGWKVSSNYSSTLLHGGNVPKHEMNWTPWNNTTTWLNLPKLCLKGAYAKFERVKFPENSMSAEFEWSKWTQYSRWCKCIKVMNDDDEWRINQCIHPVDASSWQMVKCTKALQQRGNATQLLDRSMTW